MVAIGHRIPFGSLDTSIPAFAATVPTRCTWHSQLIFMPIL